MYFTSLQFLDVPINLKFANKDSIIRKTSWKFHVHYVNTAFDFLGNCLLEKRKYVAIESSYFSVEYKNKVLLIYCSFSSFFFFLKDKKLKKLAVTLKLFTVLSLNSNVFC